jgi:hypothetical protein
MKKKRAAKAVPRARPRRPAKAPSRARPKAPAQPVPRAPERRAVVTSVSARMVEAAIPYLEVSIRERITEDSMVRVFEQVSVEVLVHRPRRVLVDMREAPVALTISDMNGMAKLVAGGFAGVIDKLAMILRRQDIQAEKFFEPSVSSRGLPTLVTPDADEAIYWLVAKLKPAR